MRATGNRPGHPVRPSTACRMPAPLRARRNFTPMTMTTYAEMNTRLVGLLRKSDQPDKLYAADRIEQLEAVLREVVEWLAEAAYGPHRVDCKISTEVPGDCFQRAYCTCNLDGLIDRASEALRQAPKETP